MDNAASSADRFDGASADTRPSPTSALPIAATHEISVAVQAAVAAAFRDSRRRKPGFWTGLLIGLLIAATGIAAVAVLALTETLGG